VCVSGCRWGCWRTGTLNSPRKNSPRVVAWGVESKAENRAVFGNELRHNSAHQREREHNGDDSTTMQRRYSDDTATIQRRRNNNATTQRRWWHQMRLSRPGVRLGALWGWRIGRRRRAWEIELSGHTAVPSRPPLPRPVRAKSMSWTLEQENKKQLYSRRSQASFTII